MILRWLNEFKTIKKNMALNGRTTLFQISCNDCSANSETKPAKPLDKCLSVDFKADSKCWEFIFAPILNYLSRDTHLSPQLLKFLLNSLDSIDDPKQIKQLQTLLEVHSMLHPPCRVGMYKYYTSVFLDALNSNIFDQSSLRGNFFDLTRKMWTAVKTKSNAQNNTTASTDEVIAISTSPKKTIQIMQNVLKLNKITKPRPNCKVNGDKLDVLMFLFKFHVDILQHDLIVQLKKPLSGFSLEPLVVKLVWGPSSGDVGVITSHCEAMFALYALISANYRQDIGSYIVLLAETVRKYDTTADAEFPYWGKSCFNFASSLALRLTKQEGVNDDSLELIRSLPSNWLKHQVGASLIHTHLINQKMMCTPVSTRKKRKRRRN